MCDKTSDVHGERELGGPQKVSRKALHSSIHESSASVWASVDGSRDHHSFIIAIMRFLSPQLDMVGTRFAGSKRPALNGHHRRTIDIQIGPETRMSI